jgi:hypothetical protein
MPAAPLGCVEGDDGNTVALLVEADGVQIAKRGRPGTERASRWIVVEPGYEVINDPDDGAIIVTYRGSMITVQ